MCFNVYSYTNKGGRNHNEDSCGYWQSDDRGVFVVADGLGGHGHGEVASEIAVNYMLDAVKNNFTVCNDGLINLLNATNREILNRQNTEPELKSMRTTVVTALFSNDIFRYFNVGDSRFYYFKNGCLYAQSKDHSVSQMAVDLGEITADEIRYHDDRSKLLKVLGDVEALNITKAEPEIKIENGDAFLLCTDGFWEYVFETEMELDLIKSDSPQEWSEFMCKRLLRRVTGNNDNFTVLCGVTKNR
jgi:serine/threonine protein phosphatase PrpC